MNPDRRVTYVAFYLRSDQELTCVDGEERSHHSYVSGVVESSQELRSPIISLELLTQRLFHHPSASIQVKVSESR